MIDTSWFHGERDGARLGERREGVDDLLQCRGIGSNGMGWNERREISGEDGKPMGMFGNVEGC